MDRDWVPKEKGSFLFARLNAMSTHNVISVGAAQRYIYIYV